MIATLLHSLNNAMQIINEPDKYSEETKWLSQLLQLQKCPVAYMSCKHKGK